MCLRRWPILPAMNEDEISYEMYLSARDAAEIQVLSWQGVGGKAYLTRDVRLRVLGKAIAPDLVLLHGATLWIIEVKGSHAESQVEDEPKLRRLADNLSGGEIVRQVSS